VGGAGAFQFGGSDLKAVLGFDRGIIIFPLLCVRGGFFDVILSGHFHSVISKI